VEWGFGGGVKYQGVSQTDRDVRFANTLARLLKERFPDRELFLQLNAYGLARNPPIGLKPDDNVIISSVANFHMRSPAERELAMSQHAGWAKVTKHLMWRPNLGSPAGLSWGMPDVAMTQAGEDFRFAAETHCLGLYFDLFWQHWANQGPHYYALAHLAWNPQADVAAVMADYYERGFGPAASDVKAYWQLLERTRMEFVAEEPSRHRAFDLPKKLRPSRDAFIACARQPGTWNRGYLHSANGVCCIVGDELWFYFGAWSGQSQRENAESVGRTRPQRASRRVKHSPLNTTD